MQGRRPSTGRGCRRSGSRLTWPGSGRTVAGMAKTKGPRVSVSIGSRMDKRSADSAFAGVEHRARRVAGERLDVRLSKQEQRWLTQMAKAAGISVSAWIRAAIRMHSAAAPYLGYVPPSAIGLTPLRTKRDGTVELVRAPPGESTVRIDDDALGIHGDYVEKPKQGRVKR